MHYIETLSHSCKELYIFFTKTREWGPLKKKKHAKGKETETAHKTFDSL